MKAREIAFKVLCDIDKNNNYSNIAINKHFRDLKMSDQDRGLATQLIYGVVEKKLYIDFMINKLSKIKVKKMSHFVKVILRMGVYQIIFLDSISDYAAVNEMVNLIKKYDKRSSGFVNAVLRNVIRQKDTVVNIDTKDKAEYLSIKYSCNKWLVEKWIKEYGLEFTEDLLEANDETPSIYIRTNTTKINRDELIEKLTAMGVKCTKVNMVSEAIRVENLKNIENNKLFKDGLFTIQDVSSMLVGNIINPEENSLVLDVCSAPGGKTTHLAEKMNNTGLVVSRDVFEHKTKLINNSVKRLNLRNVKIELSDATKVDKESLSKFDYVLTDVPCSGLGIIRRKPEIKYKELKEIENLPSIQKLILQNASKYVKINGILVYSTCTIEDTENEDVLKDFLKENDNFELVPIKEVNVDLDNQDKGYLKIYPNIHGIDGFFIAKLKRVR